MKPQQKLETLSEFTFVPPLRSSRAASLMNPMIR